MRKRHFLIYYDQRVKEIIKTIPRTWAKANKAHFPRHTFVGKNHPTDEIIEKYLEKNYGFTKEINNDFVVVYNFNQSIPAANGLNFIL
jgi:hypothetical protein